MKNVWTIAVNVIKDASRRKLFYVVFLFGIAVVAVSPMLPSFELGIQTQFLRDISLSLTSLFGVILAVILSINQIPREVENRTIYNILSKPVSRLQYLTGKYIGILLSLAIILLIMGIEILILILAKIQVFTPVIFQGVFSIFLECAVVSAFTLLLSTFWSVPVNAFATILFYVLCHVKTGFLYDKLVKETSGFIKVISWPVYYLIPNLENFNISEQVGYGSGVTLSYLLRITGYAALFAGMFLIIAHLVFRRKDL